MSRRRPMTVGQEGSLWRFPFEPVLHREPIYGVAWEKVANPVLRRTGSSVGLVANAGVGHSVVTNHFDSLPIWGEIRDVTDSLGNVFVRIPKVYIRKIDDAGFLSCLLYTSPSPRDS